MPVFVWKGRTMAGESQAGELTFDRQEEAIDFLHSVKVKVWGAQIIFADWLADRFEHLMEYNKRLNIECPQFTIHTPLPGTVDWKKYYDELVTHDRRYFDFLHPVLPTALPIREFIDHHNADPKSFVWTKKAEDILAKVTRARAALNKIPSA